ncbi:MAG TPA: hypothetical protein ENI68_09965 [Gammaproteobacteria bacterium]|nr:hypothetical protein [Gammaproteobacteria bacterium]
MDAVTELIREHAPVDVALWWLTSIVKFNEARGGKTLDECLDIEPHSQHFPSFRAAKVERDKHLRAAYEDMAHPSIRSFQTRIESFLQRTWPGIQVYAQPPGRLTIVEYELFLALKTGVRIPGSVGQLAESVRKVG